MNSRGLPCQLMLRRSFTPQAAGTSVQTVSSVWNGVGLGQPPTGPASVICGPSKPMVLPFA